MTDQPKRVKIRVVPHDYATEDNSRAEFFDDTKPAELEGIIGDDEWAEFMSGVDGIYYPTFSCWPCICCGGIICCLPSCCQVWCCVIPLIFYCMKKDNQRDRDVVRDLDAWLKHEAQHNPVFKDNRIALSAKKSVVTHEPIIEVVIGVDVADGGDAKADDDEIGSSEVHGDEDAAPAKSDASTVSENNRGGGLDDIDETEDGDENDGGDEDLDGLD